MTASCGIPGSRRRNPDRASLLAREPHTRHRLLVRAICRTPPWRAVRAGVVVTCVVAACLAAAPPAGVDGVVSSESVVWLDVEGLCSSSRAPAAYGATGIILEDGIILTVAHLFWCDDEARHHSDWLYSPEIAIDGRRCPLAADCSPNPRWDEALDLALVAPSSPLRSGVRIAESAAGELDLQRRRVWIVGYRRGDLEVIPARIASASRELLIRVKEPIVHGCSGSAVLDERGDLIGVVTAKRLDDMVVVATRVTRDIIATLREDWMPGDAREGNGGDSEEAP